MDIDENKEGEDERPENPTDGDDWTWPIEGDKKPKQPKKKPRKPKKKVKKPKKKLRPW